MNNHYNSHSDLVMGAAQVFHWATKRHFLLWFTGEEPKRDRRVEKVLRRLSVAKRLRAVRYGNKLIYAVPRKTKGFDGSNVYHGLSCTECLVRCFRSDTNCEVIPEKLFRGFGCVPEWGIRYPNGSILLLEFCTKDNFYFSGNMRGKLEAYKENIWRIEEEFQAEGVVLFVIDIPRDAVKRFVENTDDDYLFFTDYETFLKAPIGKQLQEPIYIWVDGKEYGLNV